MRLTPHANIIIKPNRQRRTVDPAKVMELAEAIQKKGLLHLPAMREEDGQIILVAGETRIKAMQTIWDLGGSFRYDGQEVPEGQVPYTLLGELDELEREEVELDENLKRTDLDWQDKADALRRLHELRTKQKAAVGQTHTIAETAKEVKGSSEGWYQDSTRKEIIVAKNLDNPVVAKAKTVEEAYKILVKQEERENNIKLAAAVGKTFTADTHKAYNVNCIEWMQQAILNPAERFDVILTDPPYGMGADTFGDGGGKLAGIEHHYDDSESAWRVLMTNWTQLSYAITKEQAHAYVFCDLDRFHELKHFMQEAGWYVFRTPFIAHKINSGRVPLPDRGPRRSYEVLLYAIKGNKPVTQIYPDVISTQADDQMLHGAQKPVALYQNLLQRSVKPGDRVLDSFCGTGTIFPACHTMHCEAVGLEMDAGSFGICLKRLQDLKAMETPGLF